MTKTLQERLRADADEIAGWGAGNEAATVREAADALDAKDALLREAREFVENVINAVNGDGEFAASADDADQMLDAMYGPATDLLLKLTDAQK